MHKRCGWQDGLASRRLRRLQSGRRACTSISTTGVLRSRLNLEVLFYEPCRASDGVCPVVSAFTVQFKCLLICRVWRRIPAHFRLHYSELAEKTNVTAEDVNPTSRWVEFKPLLKPIVPIRKSTCMCKLQVIKGEGSHVLFVKG